MSYDYFAGLQRSVGEWGDKTFPYSTGQSVLAHLRREVAELDQALAHNCPPKLEEEAADCLLLLMHLAHRYGFNLEEAARNKYLINRQRRWGQPDAEGVVEHIRD